MAMPAKIIINTIAEPNKPTDGWHFTKHNAAPDSEILAVTWDVIHRFLGLIGEAASKITCIEASFAQLPSPGELKLTIMVECDLGSRNFVSVSQNYHHISTRHMREPEHIHRWLIEPLRNEFAQAISRRAVEMVSAASDIEKLLDHTGPPDYGDLY